MSRIVSRARAVSNGWEPDFPQQVEGPRLSFRSSRSCLSRFSSSVNAMIEQHRSTPGRSRLAAPCWTIYNAMMRRALELVMVLAIAIVEPMGLHAADIERVNDVLMYRGSVATGDAERFRAALADRGNIALPVRTVQLDSPGGQIPEAGAIASQIRTAGLDTKVGASGLCASACFLLFAAGRAKFLDEGARVGVHSAWSIFGREPDNTAGTAMMMLQAKGFGVPDRVVDRIATSSHSDIAWLSDDELASMGAIVTPKSAPPMPSVPADMDRWNDVAPVAYDAIASEMLATRRSSASPTADTGPNKATTDFKASPLYHAITGR